MHRLVAGRSGHQIRASRSVVGQVRRLRPREVGVGRHAGFEHPVGVVEADLDPEDELARSSGVWTFLGVNSAVGEMNDTDPRRPRRAVDPDLDRVAEPHPRQVGLVDPNGQPGPVQHGEYGDRRTGGRTSPGSATG